MVRSGEEGALPEALQSRCDRFFERARHQHRAVVLIVDCHLPQYDRHAGGLGMFQYARLFCDLGYAVVFIPHDRRPEEPYGAALRQLGVEVCDGPFEFRPWIARYGPMVDVVWLSRPWVAVTYVDPIRASSSAPIIYCGRDLHFLRLQRQAAIENWPALNAESARFRKMERWLVRRADAVVTFNTTERDLIRENFGSAENVHMLPAYVHATDSPPPDVPLTERQRIVFVGNFRHRPNYDGLVWFLEEIWPRVASALPGARFMAIGPNPGGQPLPARERVDVLGHVADLDPYFAAARLSVAPLRYGAGVKGKVVDSLARAVPVVATGIAAEGMGLTDGLDVLLADSPADFAERIGELWRDDGLWAGLSSAGRAYAMSNYGDERARTLLTGLLTKLGVTPALAQ